MPEIQVFQASDGTWTWLLVADDDGAVLAGKTGVADLDTAKAAARRIVDGDYAHSPLRLMKLGEGQKRPVRRGGATTVVAPVAAKRAAKVEGETVADRRRTRGENNRRIAKATS